MESHSCNISANQVRALFAKISFVERELSQQNISIGVLQRRIINLENPPKLEQASTSTSSSKRPEDLIWTPVCKNCSQGKVQHAGGVWCQVQSFGPREV